MAKSRRRNGGRVGLALASGGLLGGVYEVGALRALEESVQGLDMTRLHVYVGVSSGAFVASHLANGITVTELLQGLRRDPGDGNLFDPSICFMPAFHELGRRGLQVPRMIADILKEFLDEPGQSSLFRLLGGLGPSLPVCLFDSEAIRGYLHQVFSMPGRTDDFRELPRKFFAVATNLETGGAVLFGKGGLDQVPISRAVKASCAVPGLYLPVEVEGRVCVDGVLLKTLHSTVALRHGADLLLCVNPLVPINTGSADARATLGARAVQRGGLPAVLSQSIRILIHSRVTLGLERSAQAYPDADLLLFEPKSAEHHLFANPFGAHSRHTVCEIGYEQTRIDLWNRREELAPVFAKYGLGLRLDLLADRARSVWDGLEPPEREGAGVASRLDSVLRALEARLQ